MRTGCVLVVVMLLAGCTDATEEPAEPELIIDEERPEVTYGEVETGPAVGPDLNATTEAPPRLVEGEWWRIRYETGFVEELVEVVRVVADVNEDGYIMGMPHEGWLKEAISMHSPAFGDVHFDLSYNTHNELFSPVKFPLTEGDTWETSFATAPYVATVTQADQQTATIHFTVPEDNGPEAEVYGVLGLTGGDMVLTYDATQHEIVKMESAIGMWEVVEHGYGYEGWVTVPRGEDTAIDYGRVGPASDQHTPMAQEVTVEGDFNRMTMMHFVGTLGDSPGHAKIRHLLPDTTEWETELTGMGMQLQFYETNAPDGTWTVEDTIAGAAFTYSMGIAYHQYDILLPTGERRSDHSHEVIR